MTDRASCSYKLRLAKLHSLQFVDETCSISTAFETLLPLKVNCFNQTLFVFTRKDICKILAKMETETNRTA